MTLRKHLVDVGTEMAALEERRRAMALSVESLGVFGALDVPSRAGVTWSRRSGR